MKRVPTQLSMSPIRVALACIAMAIVLVWLVSTEASSAVCFLAAANIGFFLFIIVAEKDYLAPTYFLFLNIFLGVLDIVLVATGGRDVADKHSPAIYAETLAITLLWLVCFYVGYRMAKPKLRIFQNEDDSTDFLFTPLVVLLVILFLYSLLSAIRSSMSLGGLVQGMLGGGAAFEDQGYLMSLLSLCGLVPVIALSMGRKICGLICALILFAGIALTGRRSLAIFTALVPVVVFWHYRVRPITTRQVVLIGVLVFVFVMAIGEIRTSVESGSVDDGVVATLTKYIGYGRNTPDLVNAIESGRVDYQGAQYVLRGIEYFIPRSIWPDKPLVHSSDITSNLLYFEGDVGRPTGPFGWAFFCFGPIGVAVCALVTGLACKYFYCYCVDRNSVFSLSLYALLIMSFIDLFTPEAQMKVILFGVFIFVAKVMIRRKASSRCDKLRHQLADVKRTSAQRTLNVQHD